MADSRIVQSAITNQIKQKKKVQFWKAKYSMQINEWFQSVREHKSTVTKFETNFIQLYIPRCPALKPISPNPANKSSLWTAFPGLSRAENLGCNVANPKCKPSVPVNSPPEADLYLAGNNRFHLVNRRQLVAVPRRHQDGRVNLLSRRGCVSLRAQGCRPWDAPRALRTARVLQVARKPRRKV